jgi:hypothetical protein
MIMTTNRRQFLVSSLLTAAALPRNAAAAGDDVRTLPLRGRIVCLTEELHARYQITPDCDARGHVFTLKTAEGALHPILPTDEAAALWLDARFRTRDLQITARLFPDTRFIEVIKLQSWRNGTLHDLYYGCDICNITTHKPGPCECCQEPVEFRETPVTR